MADAEILSIKSAAHTGPIIGYSQKGGIVNIDGVPHWLRHSSWRYNPEQNTWGWQQEGFSAGDASAIGYDLEPREHGQTQTLAETQLRQLQEGLMPAEMTLGIEAEGSLYDQSGNLIPKHSSRAEVLQDQHPELLSFTVETVTGKVDGHFPRTSTEISQALAKAILEGYAVTEKRGGLLVFSSVPEGGNFFGDAVRVTNHPYLHLAEPRNSARTFAQLDSVPDEVLQIYARFVADPRQYFSAANPSDASVQGNFSNWPVQALHVHTGMPTFEGKVDTRIAFALGQLRQTQFMKLASLMQYNTRHMYGEDFGVRDVRSVIRRLLATTWDSSLPGSAGGLIEQTISALSEGMIHSPSRFPASGQHERVRFRMEGNQKTLESIDAGMNPDLRLVLSWAFINQIINVIGLEALAETGGDETRVLSRLQAKHGAIFSVIPALGNSRQPGSFSQDLLFNQAGFAGKSGNVTFGEQLRQVQEVVAEYAARYPAIQIQALIVQQMIQQVLDPIPAHSLAAYMGLSANGNFVSSQANRGLVVDQKNIPVLESLWVQNQASKAQAEALLTVRDEQELLGFFGI